MIDGAVSSVVSELNEFLKLKFKLAEDRAVLSNIVGQDGSLLVKDENRIIVSLVGVEEEKKAGTSAVMAKGGKPPIYMNLYVLFSASFNEKLNQEALKFLSAVVGFFQSKQVFTPDNTPELPNTIEHLSLQIKNQTFQEQSNMWAFLGAKYMPSILYKVRIIAIDEQLMEYEPGKITERESSPIPARKFKPDAPVRPPVVVPEQAQEKDDGE